MKGFIRAHSEESKIFLLCNYDDMFEKIFIPARLFNSNANLGKLTYFIAQHPVVIFSATFMSAALKVALKWKVRLMTEPDTG